MSKANYLIALKSILDKETNRFLRIWVQTLVPPAITMTLYFVIFGSLIGSRIGDMGGLMNMVWKRPGIRDALYTYQGNLTNKDLANMFNLPYKDLELLVVSTQ